MRKLKKTLALGCSAALVLSALSGCGLTDTQTGAAQSNGSAEIADLEKAVEKFEGITKVMSHSDEAGKEETVYVILDADGSRQKTIVSEWLKNPQGEERLKDSTILSDIRVVKGAAEFEEEESGEPNQIIWSNAGSDVYYQGTTEAELPVEVDLSYELDGKKVTAEELKGASGHLKLTFTYKNNTAKEVDLQGEKHTIYQPFVMLSGMMLDNSTVKNVAVTNGSAINNGDSTVVFGIAMPGLQESLGLDEEKDEEGNRIEADIPDEVIVEADVTDFSLMMTLTLASNNALSQLGLDDINSIDDLREDMDKLTDGMDDILDGTTQLFDGAGELKNGTGELSDGTRKLSDGAGELADGAHQLSSGAAQVNEGAVALKDGLESLNGSAPELEKGVNALVKGAGELTDGFDSIQENNDTLNEGAKKISDGLSELSSNLNNEESQQKLGQLVTGSQSFSQGLAQASDGLSQIVAGYNYKEGDLSALITGLGQYAEALAQTGDPANAAYAGYIQTLLATYQGLYDNVAAAQGGVAALSGAYGEINAGIGTTADSVSEVTEAVGKLTAGAASLKDGVTEYTKGVDSAAAGAKALEEGLDSLNSKVPALVAGINQLSDGAGTLAAGTGTLFDGAAGLAEGADELNTGTNDLNSGVVKLLDGVNEIVDGTGELKTGVVKFNEEGIQKLTEVVNNDLEKYYDRLKAVKAYAEEYTSFAGCEEGMECSVKFIYKTDSIQ